MKLALACLMLTLLAACSNGDGNAGVLCAHNHSGEGYQACVKNASRF